jgi:hypothetical protein
MCTFPSRSMIRDITITRDYFESTEDFVVMFVGVDENTI